MGEEKSRLGFGVPRKNEERESAWSERPMNSSLPRSHADTTWLVGSTMPRRQRTTKRLTCALGGPEFLAINQPYEPRAHRRKIT
ncbi:hypothetical protein BHE74_00009211 [Ensete ventricosum]|nr:hypothetical protein BHE74_00009211 [Ensete ventricosum]RZS23376.1 hypothetical protein BHM03_00056290 [Ensete ventricosum]